MAEDEVKKKLKDFSAEVEAEVPGLVQAAKSDPSKLSDSLEKLLALEKRTRLADDADSARTVSLAVVNLCHDVKAWPELNDHITLLCKRRAQMSKVIQGIVERGCELVELAPDQKLRRQLIETLRDVSAGKLFVELQRARLTRELVYMEEKEGKVAEASDMLQEVQVETIGAMEVAEKAEFLLEQVRLCLARRDYVRTEIISKKVKRKVLEDPDEKMQALKIKFYRLMIRFHQQRSDYFDASQCHMAIFRTPCVQEDEKQWRAELESAALYLALAPFDSEASDALHRLRGEKRLAQLPGASELLTLFATHELMKWPAPERHHEDLMNRTDVFSVDGEGSAEQRRKDLHKRVVQHNIRVVARYYSSIELARLAEWLGLDKEKAERHLADLVSSGQLFAKIDRPAGTVTFVKKATANSLVNDWAHDVTGLLALVEKTCHLIGKENMLHKK